MYENKVKDEIPINFNSKFKYKETNIEIEGENWVIIDIIETKELLPINFNSKFKYKETNIEIDGENWIIIDIIETKELIMNKHKKLNFSKYNLTKKTWVKYYTHIPIEINFEELWNIHPKNKAKVIIYGKEMKTPRWQQSYGRSYKFSGTVNESLKIPKIIEQYIDWANKNDKSEGKFNMALVNWYENGEHYIGYHSDDEKQLIPNSPIYCFSFGVERDFILKNKKTNDKKIITLENKSLIIMGGTCQKTHKHSLPIRKKIKKKRISITLRKL